MKDESRFEAFVRRTQDMVFATAVRLLGNPAEAEDVAQDVFLRAYERFDSLVDNPAAAGWLKAVTRNLCLNHLERHRARWYAFSELDESGGIEGSGFEATIPSATFPLEARLETMDRKERLERALRQLPDAFRVPLVLYHFEELGYTEIAETLGVSLGKVKTDIHRGRKILKRHLEEYDGSP